MRKKKEKSMPENRNNKQIRSIHFDLDINKLKEHYPNKNYTNAYEDIKKFLLKSGFEHIQGSDYISKEKLDPPEIENIIEKLTIECPWIQSSCKKLAAFVHMAEEELDLLETMSKAHKTYNKSLTLKNMQKEQKQKLISNYQPKNKIKTNNKDIQR